MGIGAGIRHLRIERGWSQEKLGRHSELSRGTIDNAEKDMTDLRLTTIQQLARGFEMSEWEFLKEAAERAHRSTTPPNKGRPLRAGSKKTPLPSGQRERLTPSLHKRAYLRVAA